MLFVRYIFQNFSLNVVTKRLSYFEKMCLTFCHFSYWDPSYDDDLLEDRICLNLLYVQAVGDVERGWTQTDNESRRKLVALQARGSKKEVSFLSFFNFYSLFLIAFFFIFILHVFIFKYVCRNIYLFSFVDSAFCNFTSAVPKLIVS